MTDQENEVWKRAYDIHEKYHDGPKTDDEWISLARDCQKMCTEFPGMFSAGMCVMLIDYFETQYKARITDLPPEQMTMI